MAATRAAPSAMRVICQPGMPPAVMTVTGASATRLLLVQQSGGGRALAKAAGVVAMARPGSSSSAPTLQAYSLCRKLGVTSRSQAIARSREAGLLDG